MFGIIEFVQQRMVTYMPENHYPLAEPAGSGRALSLYQGVASLRHKCLHVIWVECRRSRDTDSLYGA